MTLPMAWGSIWDERLRSKRARAAVLGRLQMRDAIAFILGNFTLTSPGNAGVIFYSDLLVPMIGFLFLWLQRRAASGQQRGFTHL